MKLSIKNHIIQQVKLKIAWGEDAVLYNKDLTSTASNAPKLISHNACLTAGVGYILKNYPFR